MKTETIKVSDIKEQFNPRSDFSGIAELAKSIESVGLLQPIVVRIVGNQRVLVDGARRLMALKKLGQKDTQVVVMEGILQPEEAQMAANLMRSDLNVLERARGYNRLVQKFPAAYNAAKIGKIFGVAAKTVERLMSVAKRISPQADSQISPMIGRIGLEDLEIMAQVPAKNLDQLLAVMEKERGNGDINMGWALGRAFKELDFSGDAVKTGTLVSAGKAFSVKVRNWGGESVYTADPQVYAEAKKAYEAAQKKLYGGQQERERAKTGAAREKELAAQRKKRAARAEAVKALPDRLKKLLSGKPTAEEIAELGKSACFHHVYSESARQLFAAFGLKPEHATREEVWKKIFAPMIKTPDAAVRLWALLESVNKYGQSSFAEQISKKAK